MPNENHYETLGVPETASTDEIKKAYRKLSLRYHPDKNRGSTDAVAEFHKVSGAFEILGDIEHKKQYDMSRKNPFFKMGGAGGGGGMDENMRNGIDELFSNLFFGGQGTPSGMSGMPGMPGMPGDNQDGMEEDIPAMFANMFNPGANVHLFRNGMPVKLTAGLSKPTPIIKTIEITMQDVLNGSKIPIQIERWLIENGNKVFENQTIYVDVPKGVDSNEIIVLRGEGNCSANNINGDVKLFIKVINDTAFERQGLNLLFTKSISLVDALCGFAFEMKYINGKTYTINNQSGSVIKPNYRKIISNMGLERDDHHGNLIIEFKVDFPEKLTSEQVVHIRTVLCK
jgi:DnaJ homolog subfamily A member 2